VEEKKGLLLDFTRASKRRWFVSLKKEFIENNYEILHFAQNASFRMTKLCCVLSQMKSAKRTSKTWCELNHTWVRSDLNCSEKIKKEQFDFGLRIAIFAGC
jgi:hypothetical protein